MVQVKKFNESDINRIREFVDHLFANPGIKREPLITGERLIMNFIAKHTAELKETFRNPGFFPDLEWNEVIELICDDIYNRISAAELPYLNSFIDNASLSFFDRLSETGVVADMHRRTRLHEFVMMLFQERGARYWMKPVIAVFRHDAADRYISEIFRRRDYIHNELVRVQKINLEENDYIKLVKVMLLLRSVIYYRLSVSRSTGSVTLTLAGATWNRRNIDAYADEAAAAISSMLPGIPAGIIRLAIKSNFPSDMLEDDEALPRFVYILCSMFRDYSHIMKPDRGAESQEKSWLGIAKKNYSHDGFDRRMIEGLYLIAGDNNW